MKIDATYTFELSALGESFDGLFVKLLKSHEIPYTDYQKLWGFDRDVDSDNPAEWEQFSLSRLAYHIAGWNFQDDDGNPLPLPSSTEDSVETVKQLPIAVVNVIGFKILEEFEQANIALGEVVRSFSVGEQDSSSSTSEQPE